MTVPVRASEVIFSRAKGARSMYCASFCRPASRSRRCRARRATRAGRRKAVRPTFSSSDKYRYGNAKSRGEFLGQRLADPAPSRENLTDRSLRRDISKVGLGESLPFEQVTQNIPRLSLRQRMTLLFVGADHLT